MGKKNYLRVVYIHLFCLGIFISTTTFLIAQNGPVIEATMTAELIDDVDNDGLADVGDEIKFTIVLTNTSSVIATDILLYREPFDGNPVAWQSISQFLPGEVRFEFTEVVDNAHLLNNLDEICRQVIIDGEFDNNPKGTNGLLGLPTDDPTLPGDMDPTCIEADTELPTLEFTMTAELISDLDGDGLADVGDQIRYTAQIINTSSIASPDILVYREPFDENTLVWLVILGSEFNTDIVTLTFDETVDNSYLINNSDEVCSQLFVDGLFENNPRGTDRFLGLPSDDPELPGATDPTCIPADTEVVTIQAEKAAEIIDDQDGDGLADEGDIIRYTVTISNEGSEESPTLLFTDTPDENTSLIIGSVNIPSGVISIGDMSGDTEVEVGKFRVNAGENYVITFDVEVDQIGIAEGIGEVCNQGFVDGTFPNNPNEGIGLPTDDPNSTLGTTQDPTCIPVDPTKPTLTVTKTFNRFRVDQDGDGLADVGDEIEYNLIITNAGPVETTELSFLREQPNGSFEELFVVDGLPPNSTSPPITLRLVVDNTYFLNNLTEFCCQLFMDGEFENNPKGTNGLVGLPTDDPGLRGDADPTCIPADTEVAIIQAEKAAAIIDDQDGDGLADEGDIIRYTVSISNIGSEESLSLQFFDTPDEHTSLVVGSVNIPSGVVSKGDMTGDTEVEVSKFRINAGERYVFTFDVVVNRIVIADGIEELCNQGFVGGIFPNKPLEGLGLPTDDPNSPAGTDQDPTCILVDPIKPVLTATKTARIINDFDNDGLVDVGDIVEYTIEITNNGPVEAVALSFIDELEDGSFGVIVGDIDLQVNETRTIRFNREIDNSFVSDNLTEICNQGFIDGEFLNNPKGIEGLLGLPTDDPALPGATDPTCLPTDFPEEVPTMGTWSLIFMILFMVGSGVFVLGRIQRRT